MNWDRLKTYGRLALRLGGLLAVVGGVLVLGLLGWQWQASVTVGQVDVSGAKHAPPDTVRHLARVDSGTVMETIDGALIADRVERHPWVERAAITKQRARRTLLVSVTERTPAALVVDGAGRPAYYLDRSGHAMPCPDSAGYDVPLVRGLTVDYHPVRSVAPPSLQAMLGALGGSEAAPLVAELDVQPDSTVQLLTTPIGAHEPMRVRLGTGRIPTKLRRLRAFAEQVLTKKPDAPITEIDLRFDGQIVTQASSLDG
jgi:cell division protein FtsQ